MPTINWKIFFWHTLPFSVLIVGALTVLMIGLFQSSKKGPLYSFLLLAALVTGISALGFTYFPKNMVLSWAVFGRVFSASLPKVVAGALGLWLLSILFVLRSVPSRLPFYVSLTTLAVAWGLNHWLSGPAGGAGMSFNVAQLVFDKAGFGFSSVILLCAMLACLSYPQYFEEQGEHHPEIYSLTLFAVSGMLLMVSTTHLPLFFIALEVMSLALYVLVGINRKDPRSGEAAIKYFVLGTLAAGFLLYGMALLYGVTGKFDLSTISILSVADQDLGIFKISLCLILVALFFKIAAVPFHFWTPDVYHGAAIPITGFMSTAVKAAAFGALTRILLTLTSYTFLPLQKILMGLALLTMVGGNLIALSQNNLKRMLAYSSISHAGYLLVALCVVYGGGLYHPKAMEAFLFYLLAYGIVTLGAFAVLGALHQGQAKFQKNKWDRGQEENTDFDAYAGLGRRSPWLAAALSLFVLALTGIPLTIGFMGKFFIFKQAIESGFYSLVITGVVMSAVSAYYYLKVIVVLYFRKTPEETLLDSKPSSLFETPSELSFSAALLISLCVLITLYFGIFPKELSQWFVDVKFLGR